MTEEEHKAVKLLQTTAHVSNNHYTIGLLWKDSNVTLPNNIIYYILISYIILQYIIYIFLNVLKIYRRREIYDVKIQT